MALPSIDSCYQEGSTHGGGLSGRNRANKQPNPQFNTGLNWSVIAGGCSIKNAHVCEWVGVCLLVPACIGHIKVEPKPEIDFNPSLVSV